MNERGLCECGCGRSTRPAKASHARKGIVKGVPARFIRGHSQRANHRPGNYRYVGNEKPRLEHRVIAETVIGKPLPRSVVVHHVDGNRSNNAHSNLVICQNQAYHALLHRRARVVRAGGNPELQCFCWECSKLKFIGECYIGRHRYSNTCKQCAHERYASRPGKRQEPQLEANP